MPSNTDLVFHFELVSDEHMSVLFDWLCEPHVRRWWGDPKRELELIRTGRSSGEANGFIASLEGASVGYIQSWRPSDFDDEDWQKEQPEGTIGVDVLIGDPKKIGKGIGTAVVRQFCAKLFRESADRIIIDPDPANERAVRAYKKAGFVPVAEYQASTGATLLMEFDPEKLESSNE